MDTFYYLSGINDQSVQSEDVVQNLKVLLERCKGGEMKLRPKSNKKK